MARFPSELTLQEAGYSGLAMRLARDDRYDFRAALFYSPVVYQRERLRPEERPQPERWIDGLKEFVRDEFARARTIEEPAPDVSLAECQLEEIDFMDAAMKLVEVYEERYVYGNAQLRELASSVRGKRPPTRLHALLCTDEFGQRLNAHNVDDAVVEVALSRRLDPRAGLHGVMPCLPFRDQNPFRTANSPSTITFAEVLFLARLHIWKIAIYRVLPGGGHMVCACDGTLYAEALGVPVEAARRYLDDLRLVRDKLDIGRSVSLVDLREIAEAVAEARGTDFWRLVDSAYDELQEALHSGQMPEDIVTSLVAGMRWNVSASLITDDLVEMWKVLSADPAELLEAARDDGVPGFQRIVEASLRYAAINLVLRYLEPVRYALPDFMRFTVHAKQGQVAFPRLGSVHPWNGTAVFDGLDPRTHSARVEPLHRITAHETRPRVIVDRRWSSEPLGLIQPTRSGSG